MSCLVGYKTKQKINLIKVTYLCSWQRGHLKYHWQTFPNLIPLPCFEDIALEQNWRENHSNWIHYWWGHFYLYINHSILQNNVLLVPSISIVYIEGTDHSLRTQYNLTMPQNYYITRVAIQAHNKPQPLCNMHDFLFC